MKLTRTPYQFLVLLLSVLVFPTWAQHEVEPCLTEPTLEQINYLTETREARQKFELSLMKSTVTIPVQHHIVRRSDGTGGLASSYITTIMNQLNSYYANSNLTFSECASVNYIDDDNYYDFTTSQESSIAAANDVPDVVNVYYFNSVSSGSSYYCGYTRLPPSSDRIIMDKDCATNGSTIVHEFGHYFSLYHTHGKTNTGTTDELVDGSNCTYAGDDLCDTPADPNLSGKVDGSCNYTGTGTDANGDPYNPDPNNIMSYSLKSCRTQLSAGQYNRVAFSAVNDRGYLQCGGTPPPPPSPCTATLNSFPYNESFESGLGYWSQMSGDNLDWTRKYGSTASSGTGPSSAAAGSYYMYIEASSPNYPSKVAMLQSPCFNTTSLQQPEVTFAYHMYGAAMGSLYLDVSTDDGQTWTQGIWSASGDQGDSWQYARVPISAYSGSQVLFRLRGITGSSYTSDIAIDKFRLGEHKVCLNEIIYFPHYESFEGGNWGGWTQRTDDDVNWTMMTGSTPTGGTGPMQAADGNYYIYVESSYPTRSYNTAVIESPCLDIADVTSPQLTFQYHMYGNDMGSLGIQISTDGGETWSGDIWYRYGNQGIDDPRISLLEFIDLRDIRLPNVDTDVEPWVQATISLGDYVSSSTKIRFTAMTGNGALSDIAIDDIRIQTSPCSQTIVTYPYNENFETQATFWSQETNDEQDWNYIQGATPSAGTGPDAASTGLQYVYVEASGAQPGDKAGLLSPCFDLEPLTDGIYLKYGLNLAIRFDYMMYGSDMGNMEVQVSTNNGITWTTVSTLSYNTGQYWRERIIYIGNYRHSTIRVRFMAELGDGHLSDIAVDDFSITVPYEIEWQGPANPLDENDGELQRSPEVWMYPNPSSGRVFIEWNTNEKASFNLKVYDPLAREVYNGAYETSGGRASADLSSLEPGWYHVHVEDEQGKSVLKKRILIQ